MDIDIGDEWFGTANGLNSYIKNRVIRIRIRLLVKRRNDNHSPGPVIRLVVLRLNVPVNNFSVMSGRRHRFLGN